MACAVPSRFALLKIVEDDFINTKGSKEGAKPKKSDNGIKNTKKHDEKKGKHPVNKTKPVVKLTTATNKKKAAPVTEEQWEEWKQKDSELVNENYADDLQQAILLSKLDFEENKKIYKSNKKDADTAKKLEERQKILGSKKQKKVKTMSLLEFSDRVESENHTNDLKDDFDNADNSPVHKLPHEDPLFFENIEREAREELKKNTFNETKKNREPPSNDEIKGSQLQNILEQKDLEIMELRKEVDSLKTELLKVKCRNKKLCNIIGQGEMKDKADVLMEVERLREVQSELTAEVASLHAQLEQQRSRGAARSDTRAKDKKKRPAVGGGDKET